MGYLFKCLFMGITQKKKCVQMWSYLFFPFDFLFLLLLLWLEDEEEEEEVVYDLK